MIYTKIISPVIYTTMKAKYLAQVYMEIVEDALHIYFMTEQELGGGRGARF